MVITGNRLECFGSRSALSNSRGVYLQNASNSVIQDNNIGSLTGCPAITGTAAGIELRDGKTTQVVNNVIPGVNPNGSAYGIVLSAVGSLVATTGILGNVIRSVPNASIISTASGGLITDVTIRDNTLNGCQAVTGTCGQVTITTTSATAFTNMAITDNWQETQGATSSVYGILTSLTGTPTANGVVLASNFWQGTEIVQTGAALPYTEGTEQHTPQWVMMSNTSGSNITTNTVVCATSTGIQPCATGTTARTAVGIAVGNIPAGQTGNVQTTGQLAGIPCDGTVAVGDLLMRSSTTAGSVMADNTPNPGETLGKALTTCSTTLTALLGTGQ